VHSFNVPEEIELVFHEEIDSFYKRTSIDVPEETEQIFHEDIEDIL